MDLPDFNCNYLNKLLKNISKEQKSIFLLGDFNANLLSYNEHNSTNEFLDFIIFFLPLTHLFLRSYSKLEQLAIVIVL